MGKDLKAENLTISLPNYGCNKNCPYCVAKMTGYVESNLDLFYRNINKVSHIASMAEVTSILFTSKGEPLLKKSLDVLAKVTKIFYNWPLEVQTNGIELLRDSNLVSNLYNMGFNAIAISIDTDESLDLMSSVFKKVHQAGMISRLTLNITSMLKISKFNDVLVYCNENNIRQLTLRKIVSPENPKDLKAAEWIEKNALADQYDFFVASAKDFIDKNGKLIRTTNDGIQIWDCEGVSFAHSDYCIQERNTGNNLRSLVYLEDGHLYTSWNSQASILF